MTTCAEILEADYPGVVFSSVYRTAPRDRTDQEDFLNVVAKIETEETPEEVCITLGQIEKDLGKNPPFEKGPRTIDLDILLYDELRIMNQELTIPHPRMHERRFVLEPLCELNDDQKWRDALKKTLDQDCEKMDLKL